MTAIGPILDGHVEIPLGSGNRFPSDGMLSRHPQCDQIRAVARNVTGRDWPDVPIVMDRFCPRRQAVAMEQMIVVNRPGEVIERVLIVPPATAQAIVDAMMESITKEIRCRS